MSATPSPSRSRFLSARGLVGLGIASGVAVGGTIFVQDAQAGAKELAEIHAQNKAETGRERISSPLSSLIRTYVVYSFCSIPTLVDWSPAILETFFSIPGLQGITEAVVRATFFGQVCTKQLHLAPVYYMC